MPTTHRRSPIGRLIATTLVFLLLGLLAGARAAWSHPLHTTLTEIAFDSADGTMRLTIRAFADDFSAAVARHAGKPRPLEYRVLESDVASYVAASVFVEDSSGRRAAITLVSVRRAGDLMWTTIRVPSVRSLRGTKLASTLLFEVFADQVNIVQAAHGGNRRSTLFVAGGGRKLKPIG